MRGLNLASDSKLPPFTPIDDLRALNAFKIWGVNLARFAFIWEAFESERGKYNMEYLKYYTDVIRVTPQVFAIRRRGMPQKLHRRWLGVLQSVCEYNVKYLL